MSKPTYLTTEFIGSLAVAGGIYFEGAKDADPMVRAASLIALAIVIVGYSLSRAKVKSEVLEE